LEDVDLPFLLSDEAVDFLEILFLGDFLDGLQGLEGGDSPDGPFSSLPGKRLVDKFIFPIFELILLLDLNYCLAFLFILPLQLLHLLQRLLQLFRFLFCL